MSALDPNSFANLNKLISKHTTFNLTANFESKTLNGSVDITAFVCENSDEFVVDTKDLSISKVSLDGVDVQFTLDPPTKTFGSALRIKSPTILQKGATHKFHIEYETSPDASATQWLPPSQTAGKKHPYLFTQCQAIHARSMYPCQDSCAAKITYEANITVPAPLVALMSATRTGSTNCADGKSITYYFVQKIPIPTYLVALAVGHLVSRDLSPRSKIWSEAEQIEAAAWEFAETEKYLSASENLLGPYIWGNYDMLLLPPSFPYGGMENPQMTFLTPTLISGDRSNVSVVAHEIIHSWCGNLVTNRTWEHFWLNEGFTKFHECKVIGIVHGEPQRHLMAALGYQSLKDSVDHFGHDHQFTSLIPNLEGIDPDDAFSTVPYEKGASFLWFLESLVSREKFEPFIREWIKQHKDVTVTSNDFKSFFLSYFKDVQQEVLQKIDWETWFKKPGMPVVKNELDETLINAYKILAKEKWIDKNGETANANDISGWGALQIQGLLGELLNANKKFTPEQLAHLGNIYGVVSSQNAEIKFRWCRLGLACEYEPTVEHTVQLLLAQGRMKFVRPLYRSLFASKIGKEKALETFKSNKDRYHAICQRMVAIDLGLN